MTPFQKLRQDAGLTQVEVASTLNVTPNAVSAWERGISSPRPNLHEALAKLLGVSVNVVAKAVRDNASLCTA